MGTVKITINGQEYEVEEGKTVLQAAAEVGVFIPHFCYHPHLPISGNCRMCLVDIKPGPPKLSIACATRVADGMEIDTENEKVQAARRAVMEFLLKNHPVDCPICDQAGECYLQDYYMRYDLESSRIQGPKEKVKKRKALRAGPNLYLDTERCVLCTRCVRFMRDVVKDEQLVIINRRDKAEITLFPGKELDHPYGMCLTDLCPVGAWTSADFRFKQRAWFLTNSPSVCPQCARGCNIWIDHRQGQVYRTRPRVNEDINKSFMCDEGRLSYHSIIDNRLTVPRVAEEGKMKKTSWSEALAAAAKTIKGAGAKLAIVISGSLTLEEAEAAKALGAKLGAKLYVHEGEPGWEDDFLRRADRNANVKGINGLEIKDKASAVGEDAVVLYLETLCPNPLPESMPEPAVVLTPQLSKAAGGAKVCLPAACFAETSGTFVNFEGVEQSFEPAVEPPGEALSHVEILSRLAAALDNKQVA